MCGINGIVTFPGATGATAATGEVSAKARVQRMNARLAHRGPDGEGVVEAGAAVLGHRRLSIIDLSSAGQQPMTSACGRYHLVYNGELYNYRSLRAALSDYPFVSHCDSEVLLAAFVRWGISCLTRLHGMFAFAIWDARERRLWAARDRMGIKPLYYHADGGSLGLSSEVRALCASGLFRPELDPASLTEYLRYLTVMSPRTMLRGVRSLPAGHYLRFDAGGLTLRAYYRLVDAYNPDLQRQSPGTVRKRLRELLTTAVERRLVSDVPFGAFLSGGIDSSTVVALMAGELGHRTRTFSVVFDEAKYDESRYARRVAKRFGTEHTEIKLRPEAFLEALPAAFAAQDHPSGDGPNTYVVAEATKRAGVTMALSGLGGDEVFAGYQVFRRAQHLRWLRGFELVPQRARRRLGALLATALPGVPAGKVAAALSSDRVALRDVYPLARRAFLEPDVARLSVAAGQGHPEAAADLHLDAYAAEVRSLLSPAAGGRFPLLAQVSLGELHGYLQHTLLRDTDQMSMAHALEVRVPLLDHELVEYALNIGDSMKLSAVPKALLVSAVDDLLPPEVVHRPKMGFELPYALWMRGPLRDDTERWLRTLADVPGIETRAVQKMWEGFLAGSDHVSWGRLLGLAALGAWVEALGLDAVA